MFFRYELLNDVNLKHVQDFYSFSDFNDGARTGANDKRIKNNVEMQDEHSKAAWNIIWDNFQKHIIPTHYMWTCTSTVALFVKYTEGMHYNWHCDSPYMGGGARTDFSTTVFLNEPDEYEGGELVLKQGTETFEVKLPAGWAFTYPTGTSHMVKEVTSGERNVAVFWSTSMFRCEEDRRIATYNYEMKEELLKLYPNATSPDDIHYDITRMQDQQLNALMRYKAY
jgi:PKHD-type hydroxylase